VLIGTKIAPISAAAKTARRNSARLERMSAILSPFLTPRRSKASATRLASRELGVGEAPGAAYRNRASGRAAARSRRRSFSVVAGGFIKLPYSQ
jgi:hypothetical protein